MNIENLYQLLNPKNYISFIRSLPFQEDKIPDVSDWLQWYGNDKEKLSSILEKITYILMEKHYEVLYPIEMIVIPRYPFTKIPMIAWGKFQTVSFEDYEVNKLKYVCSRLGNLINASFITRNFIVIDIDCKSREVRNLADIETRRGFHIIRFLPNYECVEIRYNTTSGEVVGFKVSIVKDDIHIDIYSGKNYLESHPLQSRYLEYINGTINVRSYKIISEIAYNSFKTADITPLIAKPSDVEDIIKHLLKVFGLEKEANSLKIIPLEKQPVIDNKITNGVGIPKKTSSYNIYYYSKVSSLNYSEFKKIVEKYKHLFPTCLVKSLFDNIPKGLRFFHGQFLRALLPHFVYINEEGLKEILNDWYSRCCKTKSDLTKAKYLWLYYTGKLNIESEIIRVASFLKIPEETWSTFQSLGYCNSCILKETCLKQDLKNRKKFIINYITHTLENLIKDK